MKTVFSVNGSELISFKKEVIVDLFEVINILGTDYYVICVDQCNYKHSVSLEPKHIWDEAQRIKEWRL